MRSYNRQLHTKKIVMTGLMMALTCIATVIIRIPSPTTGYINLGDALVLMSGMLLGPIYGGLAAGIGSMLADIIGGYMVYAPATLIIKALTAIVGYVVYVGGDKIYKTGKGSQTGRNEATFRLISAGIAGELVMVILYFIFETVLLTVSEGHATTLNTLSSGAVAACVGIIPNILQGAFGVVVCTFLYPVVNRAYNSIG